MRKMTFLSCIALIYTGVLSANWSTPAQITTGRAEYNVRVAYDPGAQTLVALWINDILSDFNPLASVSTDHGQTWQPSVVISGLGNSGMDIYTAYDTVHQMLVAGWDPNASPFPVTTATSPNGGMSWSPAVQIAETSVHFYDVGMVYDANHQALVATWSQATTTYPTAATSTDGATTWGSPIQMTASSTVKQNVLTSYDSNTKVILATWADKTTSFPMSSTSKDGGMTWSAHPTEIGSSQAMYDVATLYDPVHTCFLASWSDESTNLPMVAISENDGKTWKASHPITSTVQTVNNVYTSIDPSTGVIIAMWQGAADSLPYYALSHNGGKTWSAPLAIANSSETSSPINVTFDPVAVAFVATWSNGPDLAPMYAIYHLNGSQKEISADFLP